MPSTNTTSAPSNTPPNPCRGNKDSQTHLKDITTLSHHLTTHPPKTPQAILYFITTFHRLSTTLPSAARNGKNQDSTHHPSTATNNVLNKIKSTYTSMLSLLPTTTSPALLDPHEPRKTLSHEEIHNFVRDFSLDLPSSSLSPYSSSILSKPVVAVALPSGTLMALACVAVSTYYTLAPMTPLCGKEQFRADVERVGAKAVLVAKEDVERLGLGLGDKEAGWVGGNGIRVFEVEHSEKGNTFNVSLLSCHEGNDSGTEEKDKCGDVETVKPTPNTADDIAILLFTSGTSGTKKLVPIPVHTLIVGAAFVIDSWGLSQDDTCLNMMPLYHIGGLIRNLFAPLLSSGSTICCPSFDPTLFFDLLNSTQTHTKSPTWYYASPSMHTAILSESVHQQDALQHSRIRLICNAAGGLLPTLATQLHETFNCTVLPSYGMTECMPIASPPLSYNLSRSGTSGIPVGVEVSIQDERNVVLAPNVTGNICVRGGAVFPGYLVDVDDGSLDTSCFSSSSSSSFTSSDSESESESESEYEPECWFSTGDTGYLDEDGYLYITGRTKEIINRGGEIISPFEVEESVISASNNPDSPLYDRVAECVAFSVPHAVLQEVVGIGLVVKNGRMRPSLRDVNDAVRGSLHSAKWPVVVVYMDAVPKAKGKVVRIGLSERLGMSEADQGGSCYYEAECPAADADVKTKIPMERCEVDCGFVSGKIKEVYAGLGSTAGTEDGNLDVLVRTGEDGMPHAYVFGQHGIEDGNDMAKENAVLDLKTRLRDEIHGYLIPTSIAFIPSTIGIPRQNDGSIDETALTNLVLTSQHQSRRPGTGMEASTGDSITESIIEIFAQVLSCSAHSLDSSTDFFAAGGDSLGAGRLLSLLRRRFKLRLSIETLFSNSSVCDIARLVEEQLHQQQQQEQDETSEKTNTMEDDNSTQTPSATKTHSSTNPLVLLLHLLPLTLIYPLRVALWWTLFLYGMSELPRRSTLSGEIHGRLLLLILIMVACTITVRTIMPIVGILVKWIVIGRHKEGVYAMWGGYHSRWWFVQKVVQVCGKGIFNTTAWSRTLYYRLLGARIGKNAVIHETAQLGEYDLIEIGDNVILDKRCICRPFAADRNTTMLLSRISIGRGSTVGLGSVIAPGAVLPAETCIGANSSSWEMEDAGEQNRDLVTVNMSSPHWLLRLLVVEPVAILAWIAGRGPWVAGLIGLVQSFPKTIYADHVEATSRWYTNLTRIGFHFVARIAGDTLGPITLFLFVVLVKRILDSRFVCGPVTSNMGPMKNRSQMQKLRRALLERLVPEGDLGKVAALFGSHYEIVSVLVRMLGGRVGQRVYWPGVGPSMQDFELLDVGNDVVFGSRSHLVTSDQMGSAGITLAAGCMVADRAVVQPGTTVGENAVLGSGVLTRRNASYPADSVWVGSKGGECIRLQHNQSRDDDKNSEKVDKDTTSSTPFGRAFYQGKADYFVLSLPWIIIYSLVTTISVSLYWNLSTILSVKVLAITLHIEPIGFHKHTWYRPISIFALMTGSISLILTLQSLFALACVVAAKWALMGHRSPGSYDWDKSSYCQRWQILLTIERLRRNCYGGSGILGLLTGTYYTVLYFRALGARIGSNVALFANGKPSLLFTEPDLLTLGDRVTVDNASLVSHINSKGRFKLNRLEVRDRSVLRTGSRLLSGASVGEDACLLEHTLVMAGDYVEAGETCQGWPAGVFDKKRV